MQKLIKKINSLVPPHMWIPLISALVINCIAYYIPRIAGAGLKHYDLGIVIDTKVPLVPWTVFIYFSCYVFWAANYIIAARREKALAYRFFAAEFTAKLICMVIFLVLPTQIARPEVTDVNNIWDSILKLLYIIDRPDNLFPSIHCLASWFCCIAVRKNKSIPLWYKIFSIVFTVAICISTLTTKQHFFVDTLAGVALAEICWQLSDVIGLTRLYRKVFER